MNVAPVSVGIPTYGRGVRVLETVEHILQCDPQPAEIIVHVDQSTGQLEHELLARFPSLRVLSSRNRVGPGGGRHRCLLVAAQQLFASFDDDSWPLHRDYFAEVIKIFALYPRVAVLAASIHSVSSLVEAPKSAVKPAIDYIGCGYAIRVDAYHQTSGHIDRYCPYGFEESDIALQLHALGWSILQCCGIRVFHDTRYAHHRRPEIVAGVIQNAALLPFLRYPKRLWPRAVLQVGNTVAFMIKQRRFTGLMDGILGIPATLVQYAQCRGQLPAKKILSYLNARPRATTQRVRV